jgi:outer membrane protein assembly factor BamB
MKWTPILLLAAVSLRAAGDPAWRLWGGPNRDFKASSTGLADSWPEAGPRRLWSRTLGDGYSGIAAENGLLYTAFHRGDEEVVQALSAANGQTVWEHSHTAPFKNSYSEGAGPGPYAMPQIIGDSLFFAGSTGQFYALDKRNGRVLWSHDLYEEFHGSRLQFGYSCHPLPYKENLIIMVGGAHNSLMSFSQKDGSIVWRNLTFQNTHSSPLLINVDGQDQVAVVTEDMILGVDPDSGRLLWAHPHPTMYGLAISTPVWCDGNKLLVSSSYSGGTRVLHLSPNGDHTRVDELWFDGKLQVHFGSIVRIGDTAYMSSGHNAPVILRAVDVSTGRILWQNRDFAKSQLLWADGKLIILDEDGNLGMATVTPDGIRIHSKVALMTRLSWTLPTLVGTTLYIRDRSSIAAYDLKREIKKGKSSTSIEKKASPS